MSHHDYLEGNHEPDFTEQAAQREREAELAAELEHVLAMAEQDIITGIATLLAHDKRAALTAALSALRTVNNAKIN